MTTICVFRPFLLHPSNKTLETLFVVLSLGCSLGDTLCEGSYARPTRPRRHHDAESSSEERRGLVVATSERRNSSLEDNNSGSSV